MSCSNSEGWCFGKSKVKIQMLHVPKAGGSSLGCTFSGKDCVQNENASFTFEDGTHATYHQIAQERGCADLFYTKRGHNCEPLEEDECSPLVTFMAHPVNRFLSSFYQSYGLFGRKPCNMLYCKPSSNVSSKYASGELTPTEFALWPDKAEIEHSFNLVTWMFAVHAFNDRPTWPLSKQNFVLSGNDALLGRGLLELAKKRLREFDFVGLASRYEESMELLAWKLGIPLNKFCSCNVNVFKSKKQQHRASDLSEVARSIIMEDNSLDVELYEEAEKIFEKQLKEYQRAVRKQVCNPFVCDKSNMQCRSSSKNGWMPASEYTLRNRARIQSGRHNDCRYECFRNSSLPSNGLPVALLSQSSFGKKAFDSKSMDLSEFVGLYVGVSMLSVCLSIALAYLYVHRARPRS